MYSSLFGSPNAISAVCRRFPDTTHLRHIARRVQHHKRVMVSVPWLAVINECLSCRGSRAVVHVPWFTCHDQCARLTRRTALANTHLPIMFMRSTIAVTVMGLPARGVSTSLMSACRRRSGSGPVLTPPKPWHISSDELVSHSPPHQCDAGTARWHAQCHGPARRGVDGRRGGREGGGGGREEKEE
jgi:hypothetical protein